MANNSKRSRIKAAIFDMDGVLVDSEPIYFRVEENLYRELGLDVDFEEHAGFVGMSMKNIWEKLKKKYDLDIPVSGLIEKHRHLMFNAIKEQIPLNPVPGIVDFISRLKKSGYFTAIASSSSRELIELIVGRIGIRDMFNVMISADEVSNGKPAPDIFIHTGRQLLVSPDECMVIEDSANGIKSAKKAGMTTIGFRNVNSGNQDLSSADFIITSFKPDQINPVMESLGIEWIN